MSSRPSKGLRQGVAEEAQQDRLESLSAQWQILMNELSAVGAAIGEDLTPIMKDLVIVIGGMIKIIAGLCANPEVWQKTEKFLLLSGFFTHKLTGQFKDSIGSIVGYLPFDYKKHCWAGPRDFKWQTMLILSTTTANDNNCQVNLTIIALHQQ